MGISRTWCQSGEFVLECEKMNCNNIDGHVMDVVTDFKRPNNTLYIHTDNAGCAFTVVQYWSDAGFWCLPL